MSQFELTRLPVGRLGTLDLTIPRLQLGSGSPRVMIMCSLHGNEKSGLFTLSRLLPDLKLKQGTLVILPAANPLGQILDRRGEPLDNSDLNRIFPGDPKGGVARRLAAVLFNQARECPDGVIDFHTFGLHTRLMALFMNHGRREVRLKSLEMIQAFGPELIWQLDTSSSLGSSWGGSMGPAMAREGIPNFAVEMNPHHRVIDAEIDAARDGTLRVLHLLGMVESAPDPVDKEPLQFAYQPTASEAAGLFEPNQELLQKVKDGDFPHMTAGQLMGHLIDPLTFIQREVTAEKDGHLVALSGRSMVNTGSSLYQLGTIGPWQMVPESLVAKVISAYGKNMAPEKSGHLTRLVEKVVELAPGEKADSSVVRAAAWLTELDSEGETRSRLAKAFIGSLPDLDEDTRHWILECLDPGDSPSSEARVLQMAREAIS